MIVWLNGVWGGVDLTVLLDRIRAQVPSVRSQWRLCN